MIKFVMSLLLFNDAVMAAVVVLLTGVVVMVKFAFVAFAGTVALAGVTAAALLLEVMTTVPPVPPSPTR
jgi:hypothetical protein